MKQYGKTILVVAGVFETGFQEWQRVAFRWARAMRYVPGIGAVSNSGTGHLAVW